jgi:hypothetical protein
MFVASLWLGGCATMTVNSNFEGAPAAQGQLRSYAWGPSDTTSTGDPRLDNNRFFDERVRAQVEKQLALRGFEKAASQPPDLLVHYHASITQEIDVRDLDKTEPRSDSDAQSVPPTCRNCVYDKGTLFIDLVEPNSHRLVWRGWAEGSVDGVVDNQKWMESRIDETVAKIFTRLPKL